MLSNSSLIKLIRWSRPAGTILEVDLHKCFVDSCPETVEQVGKWPYAMKQPQAFDQLRAQFPDEWLLLADPEFENAKPVKGLLLAHGHDYLELCYQGQALAAGFEDSTIVYTGEPGRQNQKWLRAVQLFS